MQHTKKLPILFIDVETGGLDPDWSDILEIAIVRLDGSIALHSKVVPDRPTFVTEEAAKINGYTPERWKGAPSWKTVAPEVLDLLDRDTCIVAGQNTAFDLAFVKRQCGRNWISTPKLPYWHLDLKTLAYTAIAAGHMPRPDSASLSLGPVCKVLGVEHEDAHTALGDAQATARAWSEIMWRMGVYC